MKKLTVTLLVKKLPILRNPKVHYYVHNSLPLVPILYHMHPPSHPISIRPILILFSYLHLGLPSGLFLSSFPTKIFYEFSSLMHATCPVHLLPRDVITLIILGEACKLQNSSLCSFLQLPATPPLLGPNILNTLFSDTHNLCSSLSETKFHNHTVKQVKLCFCIY
jgi:hypothetical protein